MRIVRTPESAVMVDETGKRSGRGAYLCRQRSCWERALARRQLERALKVTLTAETEAQLWKYAETLRVGGIEENEEVAKGASR